MRARISLISRLPLIFRRRTGGGLPVVATLSCAPRPVVVGVATRRDATHPCSALRKRRCTADRCASFQVIFHSRSIPRQGIILLKTSVGCRSWSIFFIFSSSLHWNPAVKYHTVITVFTVLVSDIKALNDQTADRIKAQMDLWQFEILTSLSFLKRKMNKLLSTNVNFNIKKSVRRSLARLISLSSESLY